MAALAKVDPELGLPPPPHPKKGGGEKAGSSGQNIVSILGKLEGNLPKAATACLDDACAEAI